MSAYLIDETTRLHLCGNNPDCIGSEFEKGLFRIKGYDGPLLECDKCGAEMQLKTGRFGKYFGCTNSECKNTASCCEMAKLHHQKVECGSHARAEVRES